MCWDEGPRQKLERAYLILPIGREESSLGVSLYFQVLFSTLLLKTITDLDLIDILFRS